MKEHKFKQCEAIVGTDAKETAELFNKAMKELAIYNPTYEMVDKTTFYIFYTKVEREAETLAEEFEMYGCTHRCYECPHFHAHTTSNGKVDNRSNKGDCDYIGNWVKADMKVCDKYYMEQQKLMLFRREA